MIAQDSENMFYRGKRCHQIVSNGSETKKVRSCRASIEIIGWAVCAYRDMVWILIPFWKPRHRLGGVRLTLLHTFFLLFRRSRVGNRKRIFMN